MTPNNTLPYVDLYRERERVKVQIANAPSTMQEAEWKELCRWYQELTSRIFHILSHGD